MWVAIAIAIVIVFLVVALVAVMWGLNTRRKSERLRERFGPEYSRAVAEHGERRRAETELEARQKRVEQLDVRPLTPQERLQFTDAWRSVQARFVDEPAAAIAEADRLITDVMRTRGYPVGDFERRSADMSVEVPNVVAHYRYGHQVALASERNEASTEDLRQAMVHYRAVFEELVEVQEPKTTEVRR